MIQSHTLSSTTAVDVEMMPSLETNQCLPGHQLDLHSCTQLPVQQATTPLHFRVHLPERHWCSNTVDQRSAHRATVRRPVGPVVEKPRDLWLRLQQRGEVYSMQLYKCGFQVLAIPPGETVL